MTRQEAEETADRIFSQLIASLQGTIRLEGNSALEFSGGMEDVENIGDGYKIDYNFSVVLYEER